MQRVALLALVAAVVAGGGIAARHDGVPGRSLLAAEADVRTVPVPPVPESAPETAPDVRIEVEVSAPSSDTLARPSRTVVVDPGDELDPGGEVRVGAGVLASTDAGASADASTLDGGSGGGAPGPTECTPLAPATGLESEAPDRVDCTDGAGPDDAADAVDGLEDRLLGSATSTLRGAVGTAEP